MLETLIKFLFARVSHAPFASCLAPPLAPTRSNAHCLYTYTCRGSHGHAETQLFTLPWAACLTDPMGFSPTLDGHLGKAVRF